MSKSGNSENGVISVYPNPASRILHLDYQMGAAGSFEAKLITLQGITVQKIEIYSNEGLNKATLDIRNLPNGVYMLKMTQGEQTQMRKVVINR